MLISKPVNPKIPVMMASTSKIIIVECFILSPPYIGGRLSCTNLKISEITNKMRKMKNKIFAISTEIMGTPLNPRNPAISARIRNAITNPIM
jgi:hypothetical protein